MNGLQNEFFYFIEMHFICYHQNILFQVEAETAGVEDQVC